MKRLAFVTAGAAALACLMPAAPTMAASGNATANLTAPIVTVKSTGGQALKMSIAAAKESSGKSLTIRLESNTSKSDESHTWTFPLGSTGLTYTSPKGKLATGSKLGAYGALSLAFRKVSASTKSCTGTNGPTKVTTTVVKFKGTINFAARDNSKASAWGSVKKGSASSPYTFGKKKGVYLTTTNGFCNQHFSSGFKCYELWTWTASQQSSVGTANLEGDHRVTGSTTVSTIEAFTGGLLSSPKNASRLDLTIVKAPAPQFNGSASPNTLHASTTSGTAASGGGTMTASQAGNNTPAGKCTKSDGSTGHESGTFYPASWTNDSQKLTINQAIGGAFSVANGSQGYFEHFTFN